MFLIENIYFHYFFISRFHYFCRFIYYAINISMSFSRYIFIIFHFLIDFTFHHFTISSRHFITTIFPLLNIYIIISSAEFSHITTLDYHWLPPFWLITSYCHWLVIFWWFHWLMLPRAIIFTLILRFAADIDCLHIDYQASLSLISLLLLHFIDLFLHFRLS